jgi:hypothetical protein
MTYALGALFAAIVIVLFLVASWWGGLIALVVLGALLLYIVVARRQDPSVGTIERGRRREPTGTVRSGSAGAETANQRQGQE